MLGADPEPSPLSHSGRHSPGRMGMVLSTTVQAGIRPAPRRVTGDHRMRRAVLNLAALRASRSASTSDTPSTPVSNGTVTRRQALGLAGVAAVGVSAALRAMESTVL